MNISEAIAKAVTRKELSVYQIAKDTGLSQSGLNRYFNGTKSQLQLSTLEILFEYLGLEVREKRDVRGLKKRS